MGFKTFSDIKKIDELMYNPYETIYKLIEQQEIPIDNPYDMWVELHKSNKPPKIKVEPDRIKLVQVSSLIERWTLFEQLTDCFADGAMANTVNSDNIELFMVAADMDLNAFISDYFMHMNPLNSSKKSVMKLNLCLHLDALPTSHHGPDFQQELM